MPILKGDRAQAFADIAARDWSKSDALSDEEIAAQVEANPDAAPLMGEGEDLSQWKRVRGRPRLSPVGENGTKFHAPTNMGRVAELRIRLGMTQAEFAKAYGFSTAAVRSIEQGKRHPSGPTKALLMLIEKDPEFVRKTLAKAG